MLPVDLPRIQDIAALTGARNDASVTIYLASSPVTTEHERIKLELRNAIDSAAQELTEAGADRSVVETTLEPLRALESDDEFWRHQSTSLALFAAGGELHSFRLANRLQDSARVGDRFDIGALLRALTYPNGGYVLGLSVQNTRLWRLLPDAHAHEIPLNLPDDLKLTLEHAENEGRLDRQRAQGATGDRPEREKFARAVQDAVLPHLQDHYPLILAAANDLDPAYRAINTYDRLLDEHIDVNPAALDEAEADRRARDILDASHAAQTAEWKEHFGNRRANDHATSSLKDVAVAATAGQVEELHFDMDSHVEGTIDEMGQVTTVDTPGAGTYDVVDEIAVRVLNTGGTVAAVRQKDMTDGSPVAAILRTPKAAAGI